MAHWSSGYADFHEEIWALLPEPSGPLRLPCRECDATFPKLDALREHIFSSHPVARPVLVYRGVVCGDARLLVQQHTKPSDWEVSHCTWARVDDIEVDPAELGARLTAARGIVNVRAGNKRSERTYEFDFSIASDRDLHGVDTAAEQLLASDVLTANAISAFYDRALAFETARNYAGGIAEYLYWLAGRRTGVDPATAVRNREKLNRAAHLLGDVHRPLAHAITSVICFHFNHFDDAEHRALSPRLRAVSGRLARMWATKTETVDRSRISGGLAHLEQLLMDDYTASLVDLCSQPLAGAASDTVASFDYRSAEPYDRAKAALFIAEHHIATGDPRAVAAVREASQNGLPEQWADSRLDLTTNEGSTWQTAAETATARIGKTGGAQPAAKPATRSRNLRSERTSPRTETGDLAGVPLKENPAAAATPSDPARIATTPANLYPERAGTTDGPRTTGLASGTTAHPTSEAPATSNGARTPRKHRLAATPAHSTAAAQARARKEAAPATGTSNASIPAPQVSDTPPWETRGATPNHNDGPANEVPGKNDASSENDEPQKPWRRLFHRRRR